MQQEYSSAVVFPVRTIPTPDRIPQVTKIGYRIISLHPLLGKNNQWLKCVRKMPVRKASTENRLSEQKIHSLSCIKDIIRLPRSQRHTRLYHSLFFPKKNPKYRNNHNVHCCDKSCFSDRCIHDPKLLQITCNTEKHTAGNTANEKCLPLFAIQFFLQLPCCLFHLSFPKGQCMEAVPHLQ